jgi:predicted ATPase
VSQSNPLIKSLTLRNLLSFGPDTPPLPLGPLNVLIGPNGSGKSNFVEALAILRATPGDIRPVIRRGGGVGEWIWKGRLGEPACIDLVMEYPQGIQPVRHVIAFQSENQTFHLFDERIENERPFEAWQRDVYFFYRFQHGRPVINQKGGIERSLQRESIEPDQSILMQRRDPDTYPEISYLADTYQRIRIYREWTFGRNTVFREPQQADMRNDRLEEDFSNLGLFLNRLRRNAKAKSAILTALHDLYQGLDDFDVSIEGGTVQVFFTEGDFTIPATRLSDGTIRYLCLLAILCDPDPAPLICIEEPELGLHPDIIPKVADLLVAASARTQLIVTTHSDILVDAMTEQPEAVIVCEKHAGQTSMQRLDHQDLEQWLETYRLGELWTRGHLGGTRW